MLLDSIYFELFLISYFGLIFGSFASALIYRIPRNIPWILRKYDNHAGAGHTNQTPSKTFRSACPHCGERLKARDLVPFFSWAFLRGRCRYCRAPISPVYPASELSCLFGFLAVYTVFGLNGLSVPVYLLIPFLTALLFIDLDHFILPDELVALTGLLGVIYLGLAGYLSVFSWETIGINHLGGAFFYAFVAYALGFLLTRILKKDALGLGDVKFFAVAGLWLGLDDFSAFLILSGLIGVVFALVWRFIKKEDVFPFGPALILSFFTLLLADGSFALG